MNLLLRLTKNRPDERRANKWIAFAVVFNQEHFIRQWVANASRYADTVLVMFSTKPWTYNPDARKTFKPDATENILRELQREYANLRVISGDWRNETDERNHAVREARKMGGRYLLIVDSDEFYTADEISRAKKFIEETTSDVWKMRHVQLIKRPDWAIVTPEGAPEFEFALDLTRVKRFKDKRVPKAERQTTIPMNVCKCYHFSYCMPYEKIVEKLGTFGHSHEIRKDWLEKVWPDIKPGITSFHPVWPDAWKGVEEIALPEEIKKLFDAEDAERL